tara:strand:+ start:842 stop:1264 length:423 start_codon:yes stop_codon:yes gene_type:complete
MSDDVLQSLLDNLSQEQKESLVAKLITDVSKLQPEKEKESKQEDDSSAPRRVNEDFTVDRNDHQLQRKSSVKFKKNSWVDTGEDRDPDFDYSELEKRKTPRKRGKPNKQEVECHVCGKSFSMNSNLVYGEFHRCNRCTGR